MHPQLSSILNEFENGTVRLRRLAEAVPSERWASRPAPRRWSVAECVAHLNLTTDAFRQPLLEGLERCRQLHRDGTTARSSYGRGLLGGLLWRAVSRPGRFRTKTGAAFEPTGLQGVETLVAEFERRQSEQIRWVRSADGLPLDAVKLASPFNPRVSYNLFAALSILARHQQRHLWQAEEAAAGR